MSLTVKADPVVAEPHAGVGTVLVTQVPARCQYWNTPIVVILGRCGKRLTAQRVNHCGRHAPIAKEREKWSERPV